MDTLGLFPYLGYCNCFFFNVYSFLREREREREREGNRAWPGRGRERETQNPKQAPGSELSAQA